jgi:hypothetical protein
MEQEPLIATACELEDFLEGNRLRREFIVNRNPQKIVRDKVKKEEMVKWGKS